MSDLRVRVHAVDKTTAKIIAAVVNDSSVVTASCSGGSVSVGALSQRISSPYVGTSLIEITGLTPSTNYTYSVTHNGITRSGSFLTFPASQDEDFSFIINTCDKTMSRCAATFAEIQRKYVEDANPPVLFRAHVDDVCYVDEYQIDDTAFTGIKTTGKPMTTVLPEDYASTWAAHIGLCPSEGYHREENKQWLNMNLPSFMTGGDHAYEPNHCRGQIGNGDYKGCNKTLEAIAKLEWDAFIGQGNPTHFVSGQLYFGVECGTLRFVIMDSSMDSVPFDGVDTTQDHFGATQINAAMTYLDVDTVPFKSMMLETGFSRAGQPWAEWHTTESNAWKADLDSRNNLNGVSGNFAGFNGDHHALTVFSFDTFWSFGASGTNAACTYKQTGTPAWNGKQRYFRGAKSTDQTSGMRVLSGFILVTMHNSETPKRMQVQQIDGNTGSVLTDYSVDAGSTDNQFYSTRISKLTG